MMGDEQVERGEDWMICSEVGWHFMQPMTGSQTCVACANTKVYPKDTFRSTFWLATRCAAGHGQRTPDEAAKSTALGVCNNCDKTYIFKVVKGEIKCRRTGCRRVVRVNEFY